MTSGPVSLAASAKRAASAGASLLANEVRAASLYDRSSFPIGSSYSWAYHTGVFPSSLRLTENSGKHPWQTGLGAWPQTAQLLGNTKSIRGLYTRTLSLALTLALQQLRQIVEKRDICGPVT